MDVDRLSRLANAIASMPRCRCGASLPTLLVPVPSHSQSPYRIHWALMNPTLPSGRLERSDPRSRRQPSVLVRKVMVIPAGVDLFVQGGECEYVFVIREGLVKLLRSQ